MKRRTARTEQKSITGRHGERDRARRAVTKQQAIASGGKEKQHAAAGETVGKTGTRNRKCAKRSSAHVGAGNRDVNGEHGSYRRRQPCVA